MKNGKSSNISFWVRRSTEFVVFGCVFLCFAGGCASRSAESSAKVIQSSVKLCDTEADEMGIRRELLHRITTALVTLDQEESRADFSKQWRMERDMELGNLAQQLMNLWQTSRTFSELTEARTPMLGQPPTTQP